MKQPHRTPNAPLEQPTTGAPTREVGGLLIASLLGLMAATASPSDRGWRVDDSIGLSVNGLGAQHVFDVRWTHPLGESARPLLSNRYVSVGASHAVTPAYTRLAGWVEASPLAILDVRAGVEAASYFGTFGSLQSFAGYGDRFDDDARDLGKGVARKGGGSRLFVSPTLKFRTGSFVLISAADLEWWRSNATGPFYYEPARDTCSARTATA